GFKNLMKSHALIGDVRGRGLLMGFELVKDRETKEYATSEAVALMEKCREKGVLLGKGGLFGNVIRIAPPLTIDQKNCDRVLKAVDESLIEIKKQSLS
ncbi:MAG: aminotransferase class III-fold pyridoxal phosphate-dependent enzyme, partial [Proteobacteria bacterium]|nr:aminotransferase class III-fold pyridoxal phosphate-dependent enzyme [Pseudomonadota bacterium]